jgi:hypothetical protein
VPLPRHDHALSPERNTIPVNFEEPHNDGTHRLFKAHVTGTAELPAYLLTEAETLTIRALR